MGIALTDDHRELSGVARAFLTSQKVRWAARASLDAPGRVIGRTVMGARGMAIAGGTSEVTRNQIAERILGMPRDPLIS